MRKPTCERCGNELPCLDITTFTDRESKYTPIATCDCEGYCPLCDHQLELGKCWNIDCTLCGCLATEPS